MKVIDLAEKQSNNEMLPKHIRYENEDLYFDGVTYYDKEGNNDLFDILAMNYSALTHLFDEIEIIEEEKKIKYLENYKIGDDTFEGLKESINELNNDFTDKINELIDEINKIKQ